MTLVHQDSNVSSLDIPDQYRIFLGTFKLHTSEGFEEFMSKLGVSPFWLLSGLSINIFFYYFEIYIFIYKAVKQQTMTKK